MRVAYSALRAYEIVSINLVSSRDVESFTSLVSAVSVPADLLSQCFQYSSEAALWAARSLFHMDEKPALEPAEVPCRALLNKASREWSSVSRAIGAMSKATSRRILTDTGEWEAQRAVNRDFMPAQNLFLDPCSKRLTRFCASSGARLPVIYRAGVMPLL